MFLNEKKMTIQKGIHIIIIKFILSFKNVISIYKHMFEHDMAFVLCHTQYYIV